MRRIASFGPAIIVLALTLAVALPWGVSADARFVLALLPVLAIIHFTLVRVSLVPAVVAFAAGLVLDVLTYGPLGYWAFLNVAAHLLAAGVAPEQSPAQAGRYARVALLLALVAALGWAIAALAFDGAVAWRPLAGGVGVTLLCYPALAALTRPFERALSEPAPLHLAREG